MLLTAGVSDEMLHRVVAGWAQTTRQLHECPLPVLRYHARVTPAKAYESGMIIRLELRLADVAVSPVRLPLNFWRARF
jgi:hypothetical protein